MTVAEDEIVDRGLTEVFARAVSSDALELERVARPGVQPKVSASMVSTPVVTTAGPAILKLNPQADYPKLVENEHFFLSMAAKYRLRTEQIARSLSETAEAGGGSGPLALRRVMQLVAFSYLIGKGDLRAKNFSARAAPTGSWEVSAAYDLVSTQPYLGWRDPMALDLFGRAGRMDRRHLVDAGRRLGLPERATQGVLDRLVERAEPWPERVGRIGFGERTTELLTGLMRRRLSELGGSGSGDRSG